MADHLILFCVLLLSIPASSQVSELFFPGFKHVGTNLTLHGIAEFENNLGILKLTNDTSRLEGSAFYASPIQFKNSTNGKAFSFSTSFAFTIVPEYPKLGGHGFAFTIAPSKDLNSLPSQYLGLFNSSDIGNTSTHIFAVEFDTVQDFEFGDISDNHVGIDLNSLKSNASADAAYYTDATTKQNFNLKCGKAIQAWIDYDSAQNVINVTISPLPTKPKTPLLSFHVDLSPIFQEFMYVGFSASTGLLASSHYILGWSFNINGQPQPLHLASLPKIPIPKNNHTSIKIGVSIAAIALALSVISITIYVFVKKLKNAEPVESWELELGPHRYSYEELRKATKGFRGKELLGEGGFGQVFKGTLPNSKTLVAVKRISNDSKQGLREFVAEIASIGRLRHRNLVQLLGWCRRRGDLMLVYDYMENGSLDSYLFDEPKLVLSWEQRFGIIKGIASALHYLHEEFEQVVIHRDVKASNVLLDSEMNGRLGDFGLARLHEHGSNSNTTRVVGTLGYLAPELPRTGKASTGSDVYAFGALLLEVVCGRRPIEPNVKPEELVLVDWVWGRYKEGKVLEVVDPRLEGFYDEREVVMVVKLGLMCSAHGPRARPNMRLVVRYLDGEVEVPEEVRPPSGSRVLGFDDFVGSFASSSSFDRMSCYSNKDMDASFASLSSTSPIYLLHGQTR
ncbi:PREDICTED: L-type lectin-domain containing receptor kinase S.4-like [Fragaria vesca subsp. vesca]|uniref:L-type lectin-domain containing receptor kinase S.4-like n=1 Tax=Fragaria vesca subsp. vesca TaxID=101020 RepID=UPI0002C355A7|nr:PREDICTED: L-type lectin-domain containing receptor kinase S.4-like [Fragaria vesca subsp. vesca]